MLVPKKIVIGITGASGAIYAYLLFEKLLKQQEYIERCDIIFSLNGKAVWDYETGKEPIDAQLFHYYSNHDMFAPCASGSAGYDTMIICPCTMGTLGRIANGVSETLICRAADVILKERKKLILVTRETPLNLIHINNMKKVTEAGGIVLPASPSFYSKPASMEDAISTVADRIIQVAGFEPGSFKWGDM